MAFTGNFALLLAFALSVYCFGAGLLALLTPDEPNSQRLSETARRAGVVVFGAVLLAAIALVVSAFRDDFSIAYIFHHSNRDLPGPYKFATLWSGQEGSLVFWSLLLSAYGFVSLGCATKQILAFSHMPLLSSRPSRSFFLRS